MFKTLLFFSIFVFLLLVPVNFASAAAYGYDVTGKQAGYNTGRDIPAITNTVITAVFSLLLIVFFSLMLYGGILWMTAAGNEERSGKAKNTVMGAAIGLVIAVSAYAITNFVFVRIQQTNANYRTCTSDENCTVAGEVCINGRCMDIDKNKVMTGQLGCCIRRGSGGGTVRIIDCTPNVSVDDGCLAGDEWRAGQCRAITGCPASSHEPISIDDIPPTPPPDAA